MVIETATAACSVALIADGAVIASHHEVVGRGHAERLVPMIGELPGGGRADRILVDCGPGSFTGVRVGLAAAIGLGIGWNVPVSGYSSLGLVAAAAFRANPSFGQLAVVLEGGHGQVFLQLFSPAPLTVTTPLRSLYPQEALAACRGLPAIGSGVPRLLALDPHYDAREALPHAADALLLPAEARQLPARPIYGRAPDAKPQGAR
ncbi:tRNA (adenosine(37)-N6)-threonylcarbamoyltransferase complex dimerization subunit type 1 TsaB [Sphingosinithalassobacter portus]|uniref:tRNA (adenosine(37)-N6)-threonylcarbamoyltransferase complex dimerization subunit type 1 TsaB n=1 Tax=Stakelama portus TaxID=2676234 RepID=UPI001EFC30EB|nr:tRNA (adenosine(37)-N6)-threonylcarbamoyltransferase complex dimerization subunit type 1 TsaB [Sphingosinithalassobacter portus]